MAGLVLTGREGRLQHAAVDQNDLHAVTRPVAQERAEEWSLHTLEGPTALDRPAVDLARVPRLLLPAVWIVPLGTAVAIEVSGGAACHVAQRRSERPRTLVMGTGLTRRASGRNSVSLCHGLRIR